MFPAPVRGLGFAKGLTEVLMLQVRLQKSRMVFAEAVLQLIRLPPHLIAALIALLELLPPLRLSPHPVLRLAGLVAE